MGDNTLSYSLLLDAPSESTGTFTFVFLAENHVGSDTATLVVSVTDPPVVQSYGEWLANNGLDFATSGAATNAASGRTYEWHYVIDIPPGAGACLGMEIADASSGEFVIPVASPRRYYQLLCTTNILSPLATNNLGWGPSACPCHFLTPMDGSVSSGFS